MDFSDRFSFLNLNSVLLARCFQYRVEVFFQIIVLNRPLGKVKCHAILVEFQVHGSQNIYYFVWILTASDLSKDNINEYISFVGDVVTTSLPGNDNKPELFELVTIYQVHSHSKSCQKYKKQACRYNFGKYFIDGIIVAITLPSDMPEIKNEMHSSQKSQLLMKPLRRPVLQNENIQCKKQYLY